MKFPVVKPDIIRSLGEQAKDPNYVDEIKQNFKEENPDLFRICNISLSVIDKIVAELIESDDFEVLYFVRLAHNVSIATLCLMYQALKQQAICDELND